MKKQPVYADENSHWEALKNRDLAASEVFLYAVKTTRIFCRPGCSSRLPKRENIEFYLTPSEAKQSGSRPCKRCSPE
jgi:methylphosphotriester-DNA--protein-cysteine methyltransferase